MKKKKDAPYADTDKGELRLESDLRAVLTQLWAAGVREREGKTVDEIIASQPKAGIPIKRKDLVKNINALLKLPETEGYEGRKYVRTKGTERGVEVYLGIDGRGVVDPESRKMPHGFEPSPTTVSTWYRNGKYKGFMKD